MKAYTIIYQRCSLSADGQCQRAKFFPQSSVQFNCDCWRTTMPAVSAFSALKTFAPLASSYVTRNVVPTGAICGGVRRFASTILTQSPATILARSPQTAVATAATSAAASAATVGRASMIPWVALRAGGTDALNLQRVEIRLEGLQSYGVVTALLMNAVLGLYSMTPKDLKPGDTRVNNIAKAVFTLFCIFSVVSGTYTTVVFSLLSLYSKSAIGVGQDRAYLEFLRATAMFRKIAFDTFLICLLTFKLSFVLALFLTLTPPADVDGDIFGMRIMNYGRWVFTGLALLGSVASWYHWQIIIDIAGGLLFQRSSVSSLT